MIEFMSDMIIIVIFGLVCLLVLFPIFAFVFSGIVIAFVGLFDLADSAITKIKARRRVIKKLKDDILKDFTSDSRDSNKL